MYNVMIVENEKIIRHGIMDLVERFGKGLRVQHECVDAYDAWDKFCSAPPDIIITDIVMRGMTGLELVEKIREVNPEIPIILLSGYSDFGYAQQAIRYHVTEYLLKPVNIKQFVEVLTKLKLQLDQSRHVTAEEEIDDPAHRSQTIRRAKEYIHSHLGEDLSLSKVAAKVNISNNYLSFLFKTELDQTYSTYVMNKRMEKAKDLLDNSDFKIYEVAEICGYNSVNHFISVFKKNTGITPAQYKKRK